MDGVILLSFEKRVLEQRFMQVSEIKVGEVMKVRNVEEDALDHKLIRYGLHRGLSADSPTRRSSSMSPAAWMAWSGRCTMPISS